MVHGQAGKSMHDFADIVVKACSHFCGQVRCFTVDGQALPVCQRCLGLYLGALITLAWLIASGVWRHGLPGKRVMAVHAMALLVAGLGGLHVIDIGPRWRLACGLLTGHVTAFWLAAGIACLWRNAKLGAVSSPRLAQGQVIAMPLLLGIVSAFCRPPAPLSWWLWTTTACLGIAALWSLSVASMVLLAYRALARATIRLSARR